MRIFVFYVLLCKSGDIIYINIYVTRPNTQYRVYLGGALSGTGVRNHMRVFSCTIGVVREAKKRKGPKAEPCRTLDMAVYLTCIHQQLSSRIEHLRMT